jgi:hypothetical protein
MPCLTTGDYFYNENLSTLPGIHFDFARETAFFAGGVLGEPASVPLIGVRGRSAPQKAEQDYQSREAGRSTPQKLGKAIN